ncbi:C45 family autoproteolytic acyltransferase/hydolase [Nocardioides insulae]|uniref:C45 family autoproteolytic acyltransferase/hydolase n=1 Tax=Nocardioides insulae TaxID=394734 RepID=UPI0003FEBEF8|nr:C45 family peptidase [Nocardioides insulae]
MSLQTSTARFDPDTLTPPASISPQLLTISGADAVTRGRARGEAATRGIRRTIEAYAALFAVKGISASAQRAGALESLGALRTWDEAQYRELEGVAAGAGVALWQLGLVVARTEILALAAVDPHECSTVAFSRPGGSWSTQTWDWHAEFADVWHYQRVTGVEGQHDHAGFAEYGMLGKIGMNDTGLGVHLNILRNAADDGGGVPVHAILAGVLAHAGSVNEAIDLILSAPTSSSSVITVTGPDEVRMVEIAPQGKQVLGAEGWFAHTNHFLSPELSGGALETSPVSTSRARYELLQERLADAPDPGGLEDLLALMRTDPHEAPVCCVPDPARPFGERTATLVTAQFDPQGRSVRMSPGNPRDVTPENVTVFSF